MLKIKVLTFRKIGFFPSLSVHTCNLLIYYCFQWQLLILEDFWFLYFPSLYKKGKNNSIFNTQFHIDRMMSEDELHRGGRVGDSASKDLAQLKAHLIFPCPPEFGSDNELLQPSYNHRPKILLRLMPSNP